MTSIHDLFRRRLKPREAGPEQTVPDLPPAATEPAAVDDPPEPEPEPEPERSAGAEGSSTAGGGSGAAGSPRTATAVVDAQARSSASSTGNGSSAIPDGGVSVASDAGGHDGPATSRVTVEPTSLELVPAPRSGPFAPEPDDPEPTSAATTIDGSDSRRGEGGHGSATRQEPAAPGDPPTSGSGEDPRADAGPASRPPVPAPGDESVQTVNAAQEAPQVGEVRRQAGVRPHEVGEWRGVVLVTGTDTDVGKTIVTSAIAAAAQGAGLRVAVIKPGQTGTAGGAPTDIDLINRLAAPETTRTLASYPDPLAPLAAAQVASMPPLELYEVVDAIRAEADKHDLVLVEGAGGLLVPMGVRPSGEAWTFADLATTLGVSVVVVARAGLGTLNHTALTLEALERRGVPAGVVLGAWPNEPELVHWANLSELIPHMIGALPDGAGAMDPGVFRRSAPGWLTPALYGVLDNWRVWADEIS
jgi:dethiobiotin synthetase